MSRDIKVTIGIVAVLLGAMFAMDGRAPTWLRQAGLAASLGVSAGFVYALFLPRDIRDIFGRALLVLIPVVLIGSASVLAIINLSGLEWRLQQALVAAIVVVGGWLVTFFFQETRRTDERAEQTTDMVLALRAEIQDCYATYIYRDRQTVEFGEQIANLIEAGGDGKTAYHPFIARDAKPLIFEAIRSDIRVLPAEVIDTVIQFYCQLGDVKAFAAQMMTEEFRTMPAGRRAPAYRHYINMTVEAEFRAADALIALNRSLGVSAEWLKTKRAARAALLNYEIADE